MQTIKTFLTNPIYLNSESFYPRCYDPVFLFVQEKLSKFPDLESFLARDVTGGSTPPYYLFKEKHEDGVPFIKTSAISRHFINTNDLHFIDEDFHQKTIKRSITKPYDVIFSMTGKFMGKAAICPLTLDEVNISQNSVVLHSDNPCKSAYLTIFLNSIINQQQVKGSYSITKQKYLNQGKISKLKIIPYNKDFNSNLENYLNGINDYYQSVEKINSIIEKFNLNYVNLDKDYNKCFSYLTPSKDMDKTILLPNKYRTDFTKIISKTPMTSLNLSMYKKNKGDEIGSKNYLFEGVPFIKTSNFLNYNVDYEPNYYCSDAIYNELEQDIKIGDILFTKDGKIGEVALVEENAKIAICAGINRIRPTSIEDRYLLFLLLSSDYGKIFFKKWSVIASTMAHLRKDFYSDFLIPNIPDKDNYIKSLQTAFEMKKNAFNVIMNEKELVVNKIFKNINIDLL